MEEEFLNLPFFVENGWIKKACKVCGRTFWTLDPDREVCGDQPCEEYSFIGERVGAAVSSPSEVRARFIDFFSRRGHTPVRRYPVVARWREDVYLVGASIYDFQPWVTEGVVPPPANPLVISQPSIRLTDLENVGRTGRHFTGFEMMAHHAFNIGGINVYWANETVEYAYELFTKSYGVNPREITFIFDVWSGGGNAGEDYEVIVRGLEVATLVFMHYRVLPDGSFSPMRNRIVDTGYGLERIYWLLTGSFNAYESIFQPFITYLRSETGVAQPPRDLGLSLARKSGVLDYKNPLAAKKLLKEKSQKLAMSYEDVKQILEPNEAIYALADHTRTLAWMIGDGVVPSNSGAGYLARLLIRRSLRLKRRLGLEVPLSELVAKQVEIWSSDFPEHLEVLDEIVDIVDHEEERFRETLERGRKALSSILSEYESRGLKQIPAEEMLKLYESLGLPPEVVAEEAKARELDVDVTGFYAKLAELRSRAAPAQAVPAAPLVDPQLLESFPPTKVLYYENEKLERFKARVLGVLLGRYVILDRTAFYPTGGGQLYDQGVLSFNGRICRVEEVRKVGNVVLHACSGDLPPVGSEVEGIVDMERRLALMRHHTATHIVLGALRRVLGRHVWQAGAQKTPESVRFDFTHHKPVTPEQAREIEILANRVVMENRRVRKVFLGRTEAEQKYGFTLYQGGAVPEPVLRVVEIEGWDAEACGGLHCDYTGEVGPIKILGFDRIQDGVVRVTFCAGLAALNYIRETEEKLKELCRNLEVPCDKSVERVRELKEQVERLEKEVKRLREEIAKGGLPRREFTLGSPPKAVKAVIVESGDTPPREAATSLGRSYPGSIVLAYNARGDIALKVADDLLEEFDARELGKALCERLGGKGGGVRDLFQGKVENTANLEDAFRAAVEQALSKQG
uniref:Alanine--tRNA ligase n=1 Tax=Thermofilum pendens TaxID=2269 RepID=A0A7C4H3F4_THEPE